MSTIFSMKTKINMNSRNSTNFDSFGFCWFLTADFDSFYAYITKTTKKEVNATKSEGAT